MGRFAVHPVAQGAIGSFVDVDIQELFFDPKDGGDTFLRNVGYKSTDHTASYPRR
jgi:hypothetical protein